MYCNVNTVIMLSFILLPKKNCKLAELRIFFKTDLIKKLELKR